MERTNYKRNDQVQLDIVDLTHTGEGVGKVEGYAVFVDGCVPGDEVKVRLTTIKKQYAIGEVLQFYKESTLRQEAPCPYFGECGGCALQNVQYEAQLQWKKKHVTEVLQRLGNRDDAQEITNPVLGMEDPYGYRNKAQYKVSIHGKLGFYQKKSHHVVPLKQCLLQQDQGQKLITAVENIIQELEVPIYEESSNKGLLRGVVQRVSKLSGKSMVIFVWNGDDLSLPKKMAEMLQIDNPQIGSIYCNVNKGRNNRTMGFDNHLLYGEETLTDTIGHVEFALSPSSFFQVNNLMTEVIYSTVEKMLELKGNEVIFDLYCGMGTIGLYLAHKAKEVYGIESVEDAVKDARKSAVLNNIHNAEFIHGKAEEAIFQLKERAIEPDCVILDPPRKGCEETLLHAVLEAKPEKIVYVSCNPATMARDLVILGVEYRVVKVQPVDNFPQTMHVETVTCLHRVNS